MVLVSSTFPLISLGVGKDFFHKTAAIETSWVLPSSWGVFQVECQYLFIGHLVKAVKFGLSDTTGPLSSVAVEILVIWSSVGLSGHVTFISEVSFRPESFPGPSATSVGVFLSDDRLHHLATASEEKVFMSRCRSLYIIAGFAIFHAVKDNITSIAASHCTFFCTQVTTVSCEY